MNEGGGEQLEKAAPLEPTYDDADQEEGAPPDSDAYEDTSANSEGDSSTEGSDEEESCSEGSGESGSLTREGNSFLEGDKMRPMEEEKAETTAELPPSYEDSERGRMEDRDPPHNAAAWKRLSTMPGAPVRSASWAGYAPKPPAIKGPPRKEMVLPPPFPSPGDAFPSPRQTLRPMASPHEPDMSGVVLGIQPRTPSDRDDTGSEIGTTPTESEMADVAWKVEVISSAQADSLSAPSPKASSPDGDSPPLQAPWFRSRPRTVLSELDGGPPPFDPHAGRRSFRAPSPFPSTREPDSTFRGTRFPRDLASLRRRTRSPR